MTVHVPGVDINISINKYWGYISLMGSIHLSYYNYIEAGLYS
jgi:hypothetical protein